MSSYTSKRFSRGRRNDGQAFYCHVCNVHVKYIARHERTKKHRAKLQLQNGSEQIRQTNNDIKSMNDSDSNGNIVLALNTSQDNCDDEEVKENQNKKKKNNHDDDEVEDANYYEYDDQFNNNFQGEWEFNEELSSHSDDTIDVNEPSTSINSEIENNLFSETINNELNQYLRNNLFSKETVNERVKCLDKFHVQMKLLKLLNDYGVCPNVFDIIMDWVQEFFIVKETVVPPQKFMKRDAIMKTIKKTYEKFSVGSIETKRLEVDNFSCFVHRCSFLKNIYHLLNNRYLMEDAQWTPIEKTFLNHQNNTEEKVYTEVTSGHWYRRTYNKMIAQYMTNDTPYPPMLVALVLGQDATLCDKLGRVSSEPILVSVANIAYNKRKRHDAWFCMGFIPSYPKTQLETQKDSNRVSTKELSNEFYHTSIGFILEELIRVQKNNGIVMMVNVNGEVVKRTCYFEVAFSVGDASGNNKLCGHYVNFSGNILRKQRECNVSHMKCDNLECQCELNIGENNIKEKVVRAVTSIKSKIDVTENRNYLKTLSQNVVIPAHFHLSYGENSGGIHTATPPGVLHVLCENGLFKYLLRNLFDSFEIPTRFNAYWRQVNNSITTYEDLIEKYPTGPTQSESLKHTFDSTEYERRIRVLVAAAKRQSDRSMIKCSTFRSGVTQLSRLSGQEYPGLVLLTILALDGLMTNNREEIKFHKVLNDSLILYQLLMVTKITESEISVLKNKIKDYLRAYKSLVGPLQIMKSRVGLKISKFHCLLHMDYFIKEYGSPLNFFEGHLEEFLKHFVKKIYPRTTRKHSRYTYDLSLRLQEAQWLDLWEEDFKINSEDTLSNSTVSEQPFLHQVNNYFYRDYYNNENNSYLCGSKFKVVQTQECPFWHTHINQNQKYCNNACREKGLYHPWCNTPFYNDLLCKLTNEIDNDAEQNKSLRTKSIIICSECKVPSNRHCNNAYDIIRAHPNYRPGGNLNISSDSNPSKWHDWVEVEYHSGTVCGRVLLWCWIQFTDKSIVDQSYAMIQTLSGKGKEVDYLTICQCYDQIVEGPHQFQFVPGTAIKSVAYVLPSININDKNRSTYSQYFDTDPNNNRYFMVIKPVELWM